MMMMADLLLAEYHCTPFEAFYRFPLVVGLALFPHRVVARGGSYDGPDYVDRARMKARRQMTRHLRENFKVIKDPVPDAREKNTR